MFDRHRLFSDSNVTAIFGLLLLCGMCAQNSSAVSKNFDETLTGISMGGGTYIESGLGRINYDPIPDLGGTYTTLGDTNKYYLLPLKMGYYIAKPYTQFELYARHLRSTLGAWYGSGSNAGNGTTQFASWGVGALLGAALARHARFRWSLIGMAEYMFHKATLNYHLSGGSDEILRIKSSSAQVGGGFLGEIYLGDLWMLNLTAAYIYAMDASWSAVSAATFMGSAQSGTLSDNSGSKIDAIFGGILIEASLRLAFE